jgi:hypothetical protein
MDVVVYHRGQPWAAPRLELFTNGLIRHGIEPEVRSADNWRASDLAVVWGHRDKALHEIQRAHGGRYLVLERAYIGDIHERRRWTSSGYDGLNGRADFCNENSPPDRWEKYFSDVIKPWKTGGDYTLVMGQVPGDSSLQGVDIDGWYEEAAANLKAEWSKPVRFRPHPVAVERNQVGEVHGTTLDAGSLANALDGAACVATWNSNTGVDAVLAGVPVIACDRGSMAWSVSARDYSHCARPEREQWAANLAYCQWLEEEIASGETWEHLRKNS